jgi:hypothetical protein
MAPTMTTAIPAAMRAYSTAVAPDELWENRFDDDSLSMETTPCVIADLFVQVATISQCGVYRECFVG